MTTTDSMDHIWLKANGFSRVESVSLVPDAIRMFFAGRAELMPFSEGTLGRDMAAAGHSADEVLSIMVFLSTRPWIALSRPTSEAMLQRLHAAWDRLVAEGVAIQP